MTLRERAQLWWKWHEGWVAAAVLACLAFAFGWNASTIHDQTILARQSVAHAQDLQRMADAYTEALRAKDKLIATMANSSANAASSAAQAADAAAQAADKSRKDAATLGKLK